MFLMLNSNLYSLIILRYGVLPSLSRLCNYRTQYRDWIYKLKSRWVKNKEKPKWMLEDWWRNLVNHWRDSRSIEKGEIARQCRMSEPDGPGTGISKHRAGSKSTIIRTQDISRARGCKKAEVLYEDTQSIHKTNDGRYITSKAQKIDERVKELAAERGPDANMSQLYVEACGGGLDKKKMLFSTGNHSKKFMSGIGSSSSRVTQSREEELQREIDELRRQVETEKAELRQQLEADMQQRIEVETQRQIEAIEADRRAREEAFEKRLQDQALLIKQVLEQQLRSRRHDDDTTPPRY